VFVLLSYFVGVVIMNGFVWWKNTNDACAFPPNEISAANFVELLMVSNGTIGFVHFNRYGL